MKKGLENVDSNSALNRVSIRSIAARAPSVFERVGRALGETEPGSARLAGLVALTAVPVMAGLAVLTIRAFLLIVVG